MKERKEDRKEGQKQTKKQINDLSEGSNRKGKGMTACDEVQIYVTQFWVHATRVVWFARPVCLDVWLSEA